MPLVGLGWSGDSAPRVQNRYVGGPADFQIAGPPCVVVEAGIGGMTVVCQVGVGPATSPSLTIWRWRVVKWQVWGEEEEATNHHLDVASLPW